MPAAQPVIRNALTANTDALTEIPSSALIQATISHGSFPRHAVTDAIHLQENAKVQAILETARIPMETIPEIPATIQTQAMTPAIRETIRTTTLPIQEQRNRLRPRVTRTLAKILQIQQEPAPQHRTADISAAAKTVSTGDAKNV